jgi:hypothetical protein
MRGGMGAALICVACATASYEEMGFPDAPVAGGSADDPSGTQDRPDARPSGSADASTSSACRGVETITGLPLQQAFVQEQPGAPLGSGISFRYLNSRLDGSQAYDVLDVELWDGYGAFTGGPARPGTFSLSGPETVPATCGICVYLLADIDPNTGVAAQVYVGQSGTVTVTSVDGTLAGSLAGIMLERVDPDGDVIGDCQSVVSNVSFDAPIQTP